MSSGARPLGRTIWYAALSASALLLVTAGLFLLWPGLFIHLPIEHVIEDTLPPSNLILDREGQVLYELMDPHTGMRRPVPLEQVPLALRQAVIATEDATFYHNPGINLRGIIRAIWTNLRARRIVSGASSITQQVARNLLIEESARTERTWSRKLRETALAYYLTRSLSKDEILALYLNHIFFGNMAYGIDAAAQAYFAKPVSELDLAECAMLAGLPQAPSAYNPLVNLDAAKARQRDVLDLMVRSEYLTATEANLAWNEPLRFASTPFEIEAPHFCMLVRSHLVELLGEERLARGGLHIQTTLDLGLQQKAEAHVRRQIDKLNEEAPGGRGHNARNAAVIVLDPRDGAVRTLVGSPDYFDATIAGAVNAALALRQPGSALKPLTYAAAMEQGYSPGTVIWDVYSSFVTREGRAYVPMNYDRRYHGPVTLREALGSSMNVVAVKVLDDIGVEALPAMAHRLGITSLDDATRHGLALTLGGCEVQLVELTAAYAALARGGRTIEPYYVERVTDKEGHILYKAEPPSGEQTLDSRIAYLITDILSDDDARLTGFGRDSVLNLPFSAAVKTGTTTAWRDNWTVGYSSTYVTGVWVGNADNSPMTDVSGVDGAAPIWRAVMLDAHREPPAPFEEPPGLVEMTICAESGLLPSAACPHHRQELFRAEHVPSQSCDMHRHIEIDSATGLLATVDTPTERRVIRRVTLWPAEGHAWARENGLPLPPPGIAGSSGNPPGLVMASPDDAPVAKHPPLYLASPGAHSHYAISRQIPREHQQIEIVAVSTTQDAREITLWIDGLPYHTWRAPPYRVFWPLEPGRHTLRLSGQRQNQVIESAPIEINVYLASD